MAGRIEKGLNEHSVEPQIAVRTELFEADCHVLVSDEWLSSVGSEQPVPPRKVEAEIAVGFIRTHRVVHAVHVRRYDDSAHEAIDSACDAHVAVVEHCGGVQQHFKHDNGEGRGPSAATTASLMPIDSNISTGWKRKPVVTSNSKSAWCMRCSRHKAGTAWNIRC